MPRNTGSPNTESPGGEYIDLPGPDDFHVHLRQGIVADHYSRTLAASCRRALVMPNTIPPITDPAGIATYRDRIVRAAPSLTPLMTFKLLPSMDPGTIRELHAAGAVAGKYYPSGVTTNSEDGISDPGQVDEMLAAMNEERMVLCVHAELPGADVLDRERRFLPSVERIVARHPGLRIVVEHVSDATTVEFVRSMPRNLAATVTVHHLLFSIEDLLGNGIRPHLYCKPLLKRRSDLEAIQEVVLSGDRGFFYGSDSAPHERNSKECSCGAAGVYSAPVAIPLLIGFFASHGAIDVLRTFVGSSGAAFYGLPAPAETTRFIRRSWRVPEVVDGVVPLAAGEELEWRALDLDTQE